MKRLSLALLLSTSMLAPALADEFTFNSSVDAVTVFPLGAEVARAATGQITAGTHVVLIENLPANISADSVRVEGESSAGVSIGSVDVKQVYVGQADSSEERRKLEAQIETLNDEFGRLEQVIADTGLQRKMLQNLISNAGKSNKQGEGNALSALEVADLLDGAATRLDNYAKRTVDSRASQRDLRRQMQDLQNRIGILAPNQELRSVVAINIEAQQAGEAEFTVKYAIANAGWSAIYDAKLTLGDDAESQSVEIVRRANVYQSTTETWDDVALTLSTARPSSRTAAPVISPYEIDQLRPMPRSTSRITAADEQLTMLQSKGISGQAEYAEEGAALVAAPTLEPTKRKKVVMDVGGFQATYAIPGAVSIDNTGQMKSVVMGEDAFPVTLSAYSVPRLDAAAYLLANFELEGEVSYLPGPVLLSRDGAYIGRGRMPMLAPGDDYDLSFGQDDFIKVERIETDKKRGETGLIATSNVDERNAKITITNLHKFTMPVKVEDRLPVSNHEDIKVEILSSSTKPTEQDVDDKRGILAWTADIEAQGEMVIDFGYRISWPKAMQISQLD